MALPKKKPSDGFPISHRKKKIDFENGGFTPFSKLKNFHSLEIIKEIFSSKSPTQKIIEYREIIQKLSDFINSCNGLYQQIRLKYALKGLGRPDCSASLMDILGFTNTDSFNRVAKALIDKGMIRKVGLDNLKAKEVCDVYKITAARNRTSSYFVNIDDNDFESEYYKIIDNSLFKSIDESKKGFQLLRQQAKEERDKPKSKLSKCVVALKNWKIEKFSMIEMRRYLSFEEEIAPKSEKSFKEYVTMLINKKVLVQSKDNFGNTIFEVDVVGNT